MKKSIKNYLFFVFLLIVLFAVAGCSSGQKAAGSSSKDNGQSQAQNINREQMMIQNENLAEAGLSDLEIGRKALVVGQENADKSVTAFQIIIGNSEADFEKLGVGAQFATGNGTSTLSRMDNQAPQGQGGRNAFQNISPEERAKLMEERGAGNGQFNANRSPEEIAKLREERTAGKGANNAQFGANRKSARLRGEIIDKDGASITLKLEGGGSKFILYSEKTTVSAIKQ